jgi:integrase
VSKKTKVKGKQNNGLWETSRGFLYTRLWRENKAHWVSLGTTDLVTGKKKLAELQEANAPLPWNGTLKQAVAEWLERLPNVRPNKKEQDLAKVRTEKYLLEFFPSDTKLSAVDHGRIEKYRAWLDKSVFKGRTLAPTTITHILSDLRALLKWAEDTNRLSGRRSPFVSRKIMPKVQEQAPKGLADAEVATLTSLADPYGFTWRFLLGTGLRWAEACRARTDHVTEGQLQVEFTKGKRVRRIPLGAALLAEIRNHVGLLVPFAENAPGSFARTCRKMTGLTGVHVHQARHTFAMRWIGDRGSLATLQAVLGHRDLETTQRYARVTDDLVRADAKQIEERRREA